MIKLQYLGERKSFTFESKRDWASNVKNEFFAISAKKVSFFRKFNLTSCFWRPTGEKFYLSKRCLLVSTDRKKNLFAWYFYFWLSLDFSPLKVPEEIRKSCLAQKSTKVKNHFYEIEKASSDIYGSTGANPLNKISSTEFDSALELTIRQIGHMTYVIGRIPA